MIENKKAQIVEQKAQPKKSFVDSFQQDIIKFKVKQKVKNCSLDATIQRRQNPGFSQKTNFTNNVLCSQFRECFLIMLPAYVRLNFQGVTSVEIANACAKMDATIIISVYFGDLPLQLLQKLEKNMQLKINSLVNYSLTAQQFKDKDAGFKMIRNDSTKVLTFIVSGELPLDLECSVRYVPFDVIDLKLKIELPTIHTTFLNKTTFIDFNIMYAYKNGKQEVHQKEKPQQQNLDSSAQKLVPKSPRIQPEEKKQSEEQNQPLHQANQTKQIDYHRVLYFQRNDDFNQYGLAEAMRKFRILASGRTEKQTPEEKEARENWQQAKNQYRNLAPQQEQIQKRLLIKKKIKKSQQVLNFMKFQNQFKYQLFFVDQSNQDQILYRISQKLKKPFNRLLVWNIAEFEISLYRDPFTFILTVFLPTILLALFTLAIFFQSSDLGARIASLATLLVAYTTFLPTVRSQIPPTPVITIFEVCLYGIMSTTVLCLIRSYIDNFLPPYDYDWQADPCFIASLIIVIMVALLMIGTILVFKLYLERKYNNQVEPTPADDTDLPNPEDWHNPVADLNWRNTFEINIKQEEYSMEEKQQLKRIGEQIQKIQEGQTDYNSVFSKSVYFRKYNSQFFKIHKIFERLWDYRVEQGKKLAKSKQLPELTDEQSLIVKAANQFYSKKKPLQKISKITDLIIEVQDNQEIQLDEMQQFQQDCKIQLFKKCNQGEKKKKGQDFGILKQNYKYDKFIFLRSYLIASINSPYRLQFRITNKKNDGDQLFKQWSELNRHNGIIINRSIITRKQNVKKGSEMKYVCCCISSCYISNDSQLNLAWSFEIAHMKNSIIFGIISLKHLKQHNFEGDNPIQSRNGLQFYYSSKGQIFVAGKKQTSNFVSFMEKDIINFTYYATKQLIEIEVNQKKRKVQLQLQNQEPFVICAYLLDPEDSVQLTKLREYSDQQQI